MVIQRGWKILSDSGSTSASSTEANRSPGLQSSSDDSNCSMVTSVASPPATKTDSTMKFVTTPNMAETMLQRLKQRLGCQVSGTGNTSESAMRSLELLRISVQNAFDREIDVVIKRYMEDYFKPALRNLKENLGQNVVTDDTLQKMSCALLENSKGQYNAFRMKPQSLFVPAHTANASDVRLALKRPATKTIDVNELTKKMLSTVPPTVNLKTATIVPMQAQQPIMVQNRAPFAVAPARRQIFWNTASISTMTKFVLDVQANQAFGFDSNGNERLASKHPELIRYLPDAEDRDWLITQNIISQQNRNSRFLFLIHDEVCRLQNSQLYRNKPNVDLGIMHTFIVPEFMIQKMKLFFVDLNIKSRGLITSSFSINATTQSNSHLRNALLQGVQPQTVATTTNDTSASATQSAVTQSAAPTVTTATAASANMIVTTTSSDSTAQLKPRASTLSSSHATLTALLNNSGGNNGTATSKGAANTANEKPANGKSHK